MPGEIPAPSPEEAALASVSVQEGVNQGRIEDKEVARVAAVAEKDVRDTLEAGGINNPENETFHTKKGEPRKGAKAEREVAKARSLIDKIGSEAGTKAAGEFADKSKDRVHNLDVAREMAYAEKPGLEMAANLKAIGSPELAKGRVEAAKAHGTKVGAAYNESADDYLNDIYKLRTGEDQTPVAIRGENLKVWETVREGVAGKGAEPALELDKGFFRRKIHESVYAATGDNNLVMLERRNARTGELISAHAIKTESAAFETRNGAKIPSKELRSELKAKRRDDKGEDAEASQAVIRSHSPGLKYGSEYGNIGEYNLLQRRHLAPESNDAQEALADYRRRQAAQKKAIPFWVRFFNRP